MSRKTLLFLIVALGLIIAVILVLFRSQQKGTLYSPSANKQDTLTKVLPSETFIEYTDPSGFTFSYPDNVSITNSEPDTNTYADIQLSTKEVNGSLNLKISDSKFRSVEEWFKSNSTTSEESPKETKLGSLKALEVKLKDRLLLGALDQGVLFTIEMPLVGEDFWMKVYNKILAEFSFTSPSQANNNPSSDEVVFEGEEVVE